MLALVATWGLRLTYNFVSRGGVGHEDWRYTDMRAQFGGYFWIVSRRAAISRGPRGPPGPPPSGACACPLAPPCFEAAQMRMRHQIVRRAASELQNAGGVMQPAVD